MFSSGVNVNATNNIAFSLLVKFDSTSTDTVVFSVDDSQNYGSFDLGVRSGRLEFNYRNIGSNAKVNTNISSNTEYLVECQYDHSNAQTKLAVNGSVVDTNSGNQIDGHTKDVDQLMNTHYTGNNTGTTIDNFTVYDQLII